jgi:3-deoxy-D-manno-octulosonic-acid transferase
VVWIHAVSVGEVLAATRLVAELEAALVSKFGGEWIIVVSTTTSTGQVLAKERFGAGAAGSSSGRVFFYPLDFAWAVRAYLHVLQPRMLVLMESELWPRMLVECRRRGVPVAVVNARVSDRSYARGVKIRALWGWVLRQVTLFLAQSDEDARRLVAMGARAEAVRAIGNLKYDVRTAKASWVAKLIQKVAGGRQIVVAGSTVGSERLDEEHMVVAAWRAATLAGSDALLVVAPRHPPRFEHVVRMIRYRTLTASDLKVGVRSKNAFTESGQGEDGLPVEVIVLDTIGDLAAVYGIADVAFVGGSLVSRGGHNPLEPAQFGVPVVMGSSYENFRDVVAKMHAVGGIRVVEDDVALGDVLAELLTDREAAEAMGERGRRVFDQEQGATARAVEALVGLVRRTDEAAP